MSCLILPQDAKGDWKNGGWRKNFLSVYLFPLSEFLLRHPFIQTVNDFSSNTCFQITASSSTVRLASKNTIFRHLSPSFMVFLLRASKVLALTRGSVRYFQKNVFLLCRLLPPFSFVFLAFGLEDILGKCCLCNLAVSRLPFHSSSINVQNLLNYINII